MEILYDVYKPDSKFKKTEERCPSFRICVCRWAAALIFKINCLSTIKINWWQPADSRGDSGTGKLYPPPPQDQLSGSGVDWQNCWLSIRGRSASIAPPNINKMQMWAGLTKLFIASPPPPSQQNADLGWLGWIDKIVFCQSGADLHQLPYLPPPPPPGSTINKSVDCRSLILCVDCRSSTPPPPTLPPTFQFI